MSSERQVVIPEIGDFDDVDVIEVLVAPGDTVEAEQSLVTLESDKATMEIPAPFAGVVKELHVAVGDKVAEGTRIVTLEVADEAAAAEPEARPAAAERPATAPRSPSETRGATSEASPEATPETALGLTLGLTLKLT